MKQEIHSILNSLVSIRNTVLNIIPNEEYD